MVASNFQTAQVTATLLELKIPGEPLIRLQNYCREDYIWCGEAYKFSAFEGRISSPRQAGLDNSLTTAVVANQSAKYDSLRPYRNLLRQHKGWTRSRLTVYTIWPEELDARPLIDRLEVLSSTINYAKSDIQLRSPIAAINAQIPSIFLTQQIAPELPQTEPGQF